MVVWVMVALILGSIVYSIKTMGEYRVIVQDLQPRIVELVFKAERHEEQGLEETDRRDQVKERLRELRQLYLNLKDELRDVETQLRKAKEEEEQLILQAQKLDYESKR